MLFLFSASFPALRTKADIYGGGFLRCDLNESDLSPALPPFKSHSGEYPLPLDHQSPDTSS